MDKPHEASNVTNFEVDGGQGFSFDEVDNLVSHRTQEVTLKDEDGTWDKLEKVIDKTIAKANKKVQASNREEFAPEQLESSKEEVKAAEQAVSEKIKMIKALNGEAEQELPANLKVYHKVDGQETQVDLQELLNNFSGKQAWDKRFQELDVERKSFKTERENIEKYITEFGEKVRNNDALGAMEFLSQFAGIDPLQFRRQVRDSLTPQVQKFLEMDDQQKQLFTQKEELDFFKQQRETELKRQTEQQSVKELESQVDSFQKTHSLSEEDMIKLHDDIKKSFDGEITLELMGRVLQTESRFNLAEKALNAVDNSLVEVDGNLRDIANIIEKHPEFTEEDLIDIIKEAYSAPLKQASKNVSKKIAPAKPKEAVKEEVGKTKLDKILLNFDDL